MDPAKTFATITALTAVLVAGIVLLEQPEPTQNGMEQDQDKGFTSLTHKIEDNKELRRYGLAAVQVENKTKVFATSYGGPNALLEWEDGKLVDRTPEELEDPNTDAIGAAGCDIDGDGNEEIYVLTTGGQFGGQATERDRLYTKQNGEWEDMFAQSDVHNNFSGRSVACTYTPDGYGFFVARYGGPMQLIVEKDGQLKDVAPKYGMDRVTGGRSIVNIPGSNGVDIFVGNENGPNFYYKRNGSNYTEKASEYNIADPADPARGATVLDINKTGELDLAVANWNTRHKLYQKQQNQFQDIATEEFAEPTPARSLIAYDFNNDGSKELFLNNIASRTRAPNKLFDTHGNPLNIGEAEEPTGLGTGATAADINNDGSIELIIARGETGAQPLTMYEIPTQKPSIRIQPQWKTGAPARNAKIKIHDTGEVKPMDGGSAYLNQMEPWIHIGNQTPPLNTTITYPDGTQTQHTIQNQTEKIPYPG